eukprot:TRINITY_DN23611_c0_g1_i1.p1 TRINITY_DN23611_c0_g1~~TRINITY_DN23611_c0_g1_i1.p1  ORF type:complete len:509 (+),score=113.08 TRINITY_DN23611_c0_g1_i1:90-1616(+)
MLGTPSSRGDACSVAGSAASDESTAGLAGTRYKGRQVLSESEFSRRMSRIIERDFFPDLPRLRDEEELIDAASRGDAAALARVRRRMRDAADDACSSVPSTRAGSKRPAPGDLDGTSSLDDFLSRYTKEDSVSFDMIRDSDRAAHRRRWRWCYTDQGADLVQSSDLLHSAAAAAGLLEGPRKGRRPGKRPRTGAAPAAAPAPAGSAPPMLTEDERWAMVAASRRKPGAADGPDADGDGDSTGDAGAPWRTRAYNGPAPTVEPQLMGPPRSVNHRATRMPRRGSAQLPQQQEPAAVYRPQGADDPRSRLQAIREKHDLDELRGGRKRRGVGGYDYVSTPSISPGRHGASPLMTWGEVGGTPLVLSVDADEAAELASGVSFSLPEERRRERKARELADEAAAGMRRDRPSSSYRGRLFDAAGFTPGSGAAARAGSMSSGRSRSAPQELTPALRVLARARRERSGRAPGGLFEKAGTPRCRAPSSAASGCPTPRAAASPGGADLTAGLMPL